MKNSMQTQTDTTARTFRSALVGWCNGCNTFTEPYRSGGGCPMSCERDDWKDFERRFRIQVKRRILICEHQDDYGECGLGFESEKGFDCHDCFSYDV